MRNLKKVLSTIMAAAMLMSVVVFNASATTVSFSDKADVVNTEAVDMAVALQIINGYEDGTFRPEGNITRAEMTKMIAVLMHGGMDPVLGTNPTGASFTDVRGHWAEKYIEYCVAEGIVAGMGDGTFVPDGNVTGTQAAKMLLVALGFRADVEDFNTSNWAVRINVAAAGKKLYDKISIDPNAPLNRDNAAQMIWNALNANEVEYTNEWMMVDGQMTTKLVAKDRTQSASSDFITLLSDKYECYVWEGQLGMTTWNKAEKTFKYSFAALTGHGAPTTGGPFTYQTTTDYSDFFAMNVKIVVKKDKKTILGMVTANSQVLAEAPADLYDDVTNEAALEVDDVKFRMDGSITPGTDSLDQLVVYAQNGSLSGTNKLSTSGTLNVDAAWTVKLIDLDGNGRADFAVYVPFYVGKVNNLTSTAINIGNGGVDSSSAAIGMVGSYDLEDVNVYEGVAKGDYIVFYPEGNTPFDKPVIEKMDSASGELTRKVGDYGTWYLDGTAYDVHADAVAGIGAALLSNEYTFFVKNGFVFAKELGASNYTLDDVVYVAEYQLGSSLTSDKAKIYFAKDGSSAIVNIDEIFLLGVNTAPDKAQDSGTKAAAEGALFTYTEKNGLYTLRKLDNNNLAGFDDHKAGTFAGISASTSKLPGTLAGRTIADDAVIFMNGKGGTGGTETKIKVVSGKDAADLSSDFGLLISPTTTKGTTEFVTNTVSSRNVVMLAVVNDDTNGSIPSFGTSSFGYIVSSVGQKRVDNTTYWSYDIYTKDGKVSVLDEDGFAGLTQGSSYRGTVIEFTDAGNGYIEDVVPASGNYGANLGLVNNTVQFSDGGLYTLISGSQGTQFTYNSDTVFLVVDSSAKSGTYVGDASDLSLTAMKNGTGSQYILNAFFVADTDNVLELVLLDKNTLWASAPSTDNTITAVSTSDSSTVTFTAGNPNIGIATATASTVITLTLPAGAELENVQATLSNSGVATPTTTAPWTITLSVGAPGAGDKITFDVKAASGAIETYTITFEA